MTPTTPQTARELPRCTTHHGCRCREFVVARLPLYEQAVEALRNAGKYQRSAVEGFRDRGIVFATTIGKPWEARNEAERWEAVAFALYTDLVEIRQDADAALAALDGHRGSEESSGV